MSKNIILIGAGGHAKVVVEIARMNGYDLEGYNDVNQASWIHSLQLSESSTIEHLTKGIQFVLGLGGQSVGDLIKRYQLFLDYAQYSVSPILTHKSAIVSESSTVGQGSLICAGSIIQPMAEVGEAVIINTRSVIEHDCIIGNGTHVAPGAIVLGGVRVGKNCMIGSGAVILPNSNVPDETFVKANCLFK